MDNRSLRERVSIRLAEALTYPGPIDLADIVMEEIHDDLDKHANRAAELARQVAGIRQLHRRYRSAAYDDADCCEHCNRISSGWVPYPCETLRALGEA